MSATSHFVGNALCLDFANTVNQRPHPTGDSLATSDSLLRWAAEGGLPLEATDAEAEAALSGLRALREAVYDAFRAIASGNDPPAEAMRAIAGTYASALPHARWQRAGSRAVATWASATPEALGWRVAASAVDVLRDGPLDRVGECPSCRWLFLDTSRNGSRRWCSMDMCGSRVKSARYFARSKSTGDEAAKS